MTTQTFAIYGDIKIRLLTENFTPPQSGRLAYVGFVVLGLEPQAIMNVDTLRGLPEDGIFSLVDGVDIPVTQVCVTDIDVMVMGKNQYEVLVFFSARIDTDAESP